MVRSTFCLALFALCFSVSLRAEDTKHEEALVKMIAAVTDIGNLMAACKDVDSAKATEPKLLDAVKKFKEVEAEMKKMEDPPKDVEEALKKKYEDKMNAAIGKMGQEADRISKAQDIATEVVESMKLLSGK